MSEKMPDKWETLPDRPAWPMQKPSSYQLESNKHLESIRLRYPENWGREPDVVLDGVAKLPPRARVKFNALEVDFGDLGLLSRACLDEARRQREKVQRLSSQLEEKPASKQLQADLRSARERADLLNARYEMLSRRREQVAGLFTSVKNFVDDLGNLKVLEVEAVEFKKRPADLPAAIEDRRRRLRELESDARRAELAQVPLAVAKSRMRAQIAEYSRIGRPNVDPAVESRTGRIHFSPSVRIDEFEALTFIAWLCEDAIVAKLDEEISKIADDTAALSDEDRASRLAEIAGDMLAVEREEEALIEMAISSNIDVLRRLDANPLAVLGIRLEGIKQAGDH